MKIQTRSAAAMLVLGAVLAACAGGATAPSSAAVTQASAPIRASAPPVSADPAAQPTAPAASTSTIGACALITQAEAKAFLGFDPGPGIDGGDATAPTCAYGGSLTYGLELTDGAARYEATKGAMQASGKAQALTGVGDAGYLFIVANTVAQMEILKGTTLLTINVQGDPTLQNITAATLTALGTTVASRF
jgi:hypothetical protein